MKKSDGGIFDKMGLNREELGKKIYDLIKSRKEGKTWDFKRQWYEDKGKLLKVILSMANNHLHKDSYIIIGVEDGTWKFFKGLKENRSKFGFKQQADLISWLRKVQFEGINYPDVDLELDVQVVDKDYVDVIVIKSAFNLPYTLSKDWSDKKYNEKLKQANSTSCDANKKPYVVKAKEIYTRIGDVNANRFENNLAGWLDIEKLYRKKFGLDLDIIEKFKMLLSRKDDWKFITAHTLQSQLFQTVLDKDDLLVVNNSYPDFTIKFRPLDVDSTLKGHPILQILPPYFFYENDRCEGYYYIYLGPNIGYLECFVGSVLIARLNYLNLNRNKRFMKKRLPVVQPNIHSFKDSPTQDIISFFRYCDLFSQWVIVFLYFVKSDDFCYEVNRLFQHHVRHHENCECCDCESCFYEKNHQDIIYFEDKKEKDDFLSHCEHASLVEKAIVYYNRISRDREWLSNALEQWFNMLESLQNKKIISKELKVTEMLKDEKLKDIYIKQYICNRYFVSFFDIWKGNREEFLKLLSNKEDWEVSFEIENFSGREVYRSKDKTDKDETDFVALYTHKKHPYYFAIRGYKYKWLKLIRNCEKNNFSIHGDNGEFFIFSEHEIILLNNHSVRYSCELFVKDPIWCIGCYSFGFEIIGQFLYDKLYCLGIACLINPCCERRYEYFYLFKNSVEYKLNNILLYTRDKLFKKFEEEKKLTCKCHEIFEKHVICFKDEEEKQEFDEYLEEKMCDISNDINGHISKKCEELKKYCESKKLSPEFFKHARKGVIVEKIAEIFREWKDGKSNNNQGDLTSPVEDGKSNNN